MGRFLFGLTIGLWLAAWIDHVWPFATFWLAYPVGMACLWVVSGDEFRRRNGG